ncbi:Oidioi.mRNA.OKI2018_I69.chr1.g342.t1.cds [Oikopleura dioica]|uniref:Oidioi.mRNA.OKI2018_I69.chr1.g342.t1.cds n=1 Tax=Oikopleura dioica TaxID=34765 RepID=A0ABN7SQT4_OIKDI|nr:Oidioi.mRNA.OKI2018_I69.chr1.g342.t1.cds [Oikopleura dioica]
MSQTKRKRDDKSRREISNSLCTWTLNNVRKAKVFHTWGRREGAWMMDPKPKSSSGRRAVYVANFYYGNHLLEFSDTKRFRDLRYRKRHTLPFYYIGTGHVVYNEHFYYNRAFTRNIVSYNLKDQEMVAWTHLSDAIYDSDSPFTWKGHSWITLSVDQRGLWVIYPSVSPQDYHQEERLKLQLLDPKDLSVKQIIETSTTTKQIGHIFMMCGVLYATEPDGKKDGVIRYAIDTISGRTRDIHVEYPDSYHHIVQMQYNMREKALFVWNNRRQMVYYLDFVV